MHPVERYEREMRTTMKRLKDMDELITAYRTDYIWIDFLGTGRDLFLKLNSSMNDRVEIRVVCSTS